MLALTVDSAKQLAVAIVVGFVVLTLVSAAAIQKVTTKIVTMVVLIGLALGVWTQRNSLQDCGERVRAKAAAGDQSSTTCTFIGFEVDVPGV
jgi:hypothetical protein